MAHKPAPVARRTFLQWSAGSALLLTVPLPACDDASVTPAPTLAQDLFGHIEAATGGFDPAMYRALVGAASPFKEGDEMVGVAAVDEDARAAARALLSETTVGAIQAHPLFEDDLYALILSRLDKTAAEAVSGWTLGALKSFLLTAEVSEVHAILGGLCSDVIGCVVKLMSNDELITIGQRIFHPLPGSQIGAKGYMGARIQPNSPTDHPDDIRWQVLSGWSYAVGDVLLGNNPVSSEPDSVHRVEETLKDLIATFALEEVLPHCVLSHIDVQAAVERAHPGATALWFQSLAGTDSANETFDIDILKMQSHAAERTGRYGMYFETGQGADATNGHAHGFDMVIHEARKYGFARLLAEDVRRARGGAEPWVHVNDVAGFIGPEVFRTREQLVRCCLEDIAMGKLHGLMIGLDICSTLHMDVSLDDLGWCIREIMPANPAYLMALPTRNDPMLSYLTTAFQDHVRVREEFGYKVNDQMWAFFQKLGVIDADGKPTEHFGDPVYVYIQYLRARGDSRPEAAIREEAAEQLAAVRARGVFVASGHGDSPWDMDPDLDAEVRRLYEDAKVSIWATLPDGFVSALPGALPLQTRSADRRDYILHPTSGEALSDEAAAAVDALRGEHADRYDVQIVVSDGLNARAISDEQHLSPYLDALRERLAREGLSVAPQVVVLAGGRVRAGYRIGEALFRDSGGKHRGIVHVIGERPGTGHHNFSAYLTAPTGDTWAEAGRVDHNITRVVSGISDTALPVTDAADASARLLKELFATRTDNMATAPG